MPSPRKPRCIVRPGASLNLSTYIALFTYGYRNVYELGPQLDPAHSKLPFEATPPIPLKR